MENWKVVILVVDVNYCFEFLDQTLQYPFYYKPQLSNRQKMMIEDGWSAFIPVSEWSRLLATHGDEWRITYLNRDYKVCNSYPSALIVPRQIEDSVILASAAFRDGGRFPVLCYRHEGGVRSIFYFIILLIKMKKIYTFCKVHRTMH